METSLPPSPSDRPSIVWVAMAGYAAVMFAYCLNRHLSSMLGDPDYSVFDQACWTTLRYGMLMHNSVEGGSHFGVHNSPVFLLLLPFYALQPGVPVLLLLQTLVLALGAWPVYLLGRRHLPEWAARWMAVLYLCYHPLHGVNYDQVNDVAFATTPWLFALYFLDGQRWRGFWACTLLAMLAKEDQAFIAAALGLFVALRYPRARWHGIGLTAVAVAYAVLSFGVVLPHFAAQFGFHYFIAERYGELGQNLPQVLHTMLTQPGKVLSILMQKERLQYVPDLLAPLCFLSLGTPALLAVAAPGFAINMLSNFEMMHNSASRYPAPLIPFICGAAILTAGRLPGPVLVKVLRASTVLTLVFSLFATPSPPRLGFHLGTVDAHQQEAMSLAGSIPENLSLSTQADLLQHACHRRDAFLGYREGVQVILVDRDPSRAAWFQKAEWDKTLPTLLRYQVVLDRDGFLMLALPGVPWQK